MRKVLAIVKSNLLRTVRDRKALMMAIVMPLACISVLGAALKGVMANGTIEPFTVIVINADQPAQPPLPEGAPPAVAEQLPTLHFGQIFLNDVLGSEQAREVIEVQEATELEGARQEVAQGKVAAAIYIPPSFTADALAGNPVDMEIYTDPARSLQESITTQIARGFTEGLVIHLLPTRLDPTDLASAHRLTDALVKAGEVTLTEVSSGALPVSAMQYYAAAITVMYMLMTSVLRAGHLVEEREGGTLQRMLVSPTNRVSILMGQLVGAVMVPVLQFLVLMLGTHFAFGVYWGPWPSALLLGTAFALAAGGIGLVVAAFVNERKLVDTAGSAVVPLFAALSGAMSPLYLFPDSLRTVAKAVPNYWALQGFLDQMAGFGTSHLWLPVAVLIGVAVLSSVVGVTRLATR